MKYITILNTKVINCLEFFNFKKSSIKELRIKLVLNILSNLNVLLLLGNLILNLRSLNQKAFEKI